MRKWHSWIGVVAAIFFLITAFTGVWLECERLFGKDETSREKLRDMPATVKVGDNLVAKLAKTQDSLIVYAGHQLIDKIVLQLKGNTPTATFYLAKTMSADGRRVEIDLNSAAVLRETGNDEDSFILKLHSGEAWGDGGQIVGIGWGLALIAMTMTGIVIYWRKRPRKAMGLRKVFWLFVLSAVLTPPQSHADSPFYTDDPEFSPGWEIKSGMTAERNAGGNAWAAPVLDLNYAVVPKVRLNLTLAGRTLEPRTGPSVFGFADTEFKVKWRFVDEDSNTWLPSIGIAPKIFFPTSDQGRGLGDGVWRAQLPLQIGKTIGRFYNFGEIGYQMAFKPRVSDVLYYGVGTLYSFNGHFALGTEVFGYMPTLDKSNYQVLTTLGAVYVFNENWAIKASISRTLRDEARGGPNPSGVVYLVWNF